MRSRVTVSAAATFIAVGKTSFDDWPRLTSSLGCTRRPSPRAPPRISEARLASTSLTFILVCVPEPVCQTASGNSPSCRPASPSSAAATMASAVFADRMPSSTFTCADARLTISSARMSAGGIFSVEMRKYWSERCVCAPHKCSSGTSIGPKVSRSARVDRTVMSDLRIQQQGRGAPSLVAFYRLGADAFARGTGAARNPTPMKRALAGAPLHSICR